MIASAALAVARPGTESEHEAGYCPPPVAPAVGPDGVLYLPLQAASSGGGGSLVAVGPDGRVRPGWPVELRRPGAEFWSVVVGLDGTIYALAIEPETGDASSATILAIAPDSTVLWTTTTWSPRGLGKLVIVVEPSRVPLRRECAGVFHGEPNHVGSP